MAKVIKTYISYLVPRLCFGGGSSAPAPKSPDPGKTAQAQYKWNTKQSIFDAKQNRYTQNNPLGTIGWVNQGTDTEPKWVQTTTLSQPQQQLYDKQLSTQNTLAGKANNFASELNPSQSYKPDYSGLSRQDQGYAARADAQLSRFSNNGGDMATRDHYEKALMDRLNPSLTNDDAALKAELANQGLTPGSEAWSRAMLQQSQKENDARLAVIANAGNEMQRSHQMDLAAQDQILNNSKTLQGLDYAGRNQYMNEQGLKQSQLNGAQNQDLATLSALIQGSGNVNMPTYGGSTTINTGSAPDIAGLINSQYQNQLSSYNAQNAGKNGLLGSGIGSLGSIAGSYFGS